MLEFYMGVNVSPREATLLRAYEELGRCTGSFSGFVWLKARAELLIADIERVIEWRAARGRVR